MIRTWFSDKLTDIYYWWQDKPYRRFWQGLKDRIDALLFCLMLMFVGLYSPRLLRKLMLDALQENRK